MRTEKTPTSSTRRSAVCDCQGAKPQIAEHGVREGSRRQSTTGSIAHDVNNALAVVVGNLELIASNPGERRLLAFARQSEIHTQSINVQALLNNIGEVLAFTLGRRVSVLTEEVDHELLVRADKLELETVLVNLAMNARDAMVPKGGTLTLSAAPREVASGTDVPELEPGRYVGLSVADTGPGMDPPTLARATEKYFTTKPAGKGTGLGLAMAREFAEQTGGNLEIDSQLGRGTALECEFDLADMQSAHRAKLRGSVQHQPMTIRAAPVQVLYSVPSLGG